MKFPKPGPRKKRAGLPFKIKAPTTATRMKVWDTWFSKYVRLNGADKQGMCRCCTCGKIQHWKDMDAGHFVGRERKTTRWDERNVHPQCRYCNRFKEGRKYEYSKFLNEKYKDEFQDAITMADYLTHLGNQNKKWLPHEVEANISVYKEKVKKLLSFF